MKKIVTPAEMQDLDRKTIQSYGISGETLMENAGQAVFRFLLQKYSGLLKRKTVIFCGKGNNGGDGFVIARCLIEWGAVPVIYIFGQIPDLKHEALRNFNKLIATGVPVHFIEQTSAELPADPPDIVIDALLGTGAKGDLSGVMLESVNQINRWKTHHGTAVVSVDIPSGLNGETGFPENTAVSADSTVTFGLPKQGLISGEGKNYCGELVVADIGFPDALTAGGERLYVEAGDICALLKHRKSDSYKYQYGKVLLIAGSRGMSGAARLAGKAVLRSGAGMLKIAVPGSIVHTVETGLPEALTASLPETSCGALSREAIGPLKDLSAWCDVIAVGPGLSRNEETMGVICELIRTGGKPLVIDADAITATSRCAEVIRASDASMVFTPHSGEFAALAGIDVSEVKKNSLFHLVQTVKKIKKTILLKGSPTCIAGSGTPVWFSSTGNPGMATAGSGDVLTGIIAAFMAQGMTSDQAAYAGAWIHGLAGDLAAKDKTQISMVAGDIIKYLPAAFKSVLQNQDN